MSDDERPPLPDTDDPFVLLGVGDELDERGLKRAYAQRIKVYRPDRAPAEFARLQAAYDELLGLARLGVRRAAPTPARPDEPERRDEPGSRDEAGDGDERGAHVDPTSEQSPDALFAAVDDGDDRADRDDGDDRADRDDRDDGDDRDDRADRVDHDRLGARLGDLCARGAAADVLALVEDEATARAAERDPALARAVLRAIATMAWYDLPWPRALARYHELAHDDRIDLALVAADIEVAAAAALRDPAVPRPPAPLLELLRRRRRATDAERQQLVRALARDLDRRTDVYLRTFDELDRRAPTAAAALHDILGLELPRRAEDTDQLPGQVVDAVWRGTQAPIAPAHLASGGGVVIAVVIVVLFATAGWPGLLVGFALAAAVAYAWWRLDHLDYGPFVRRRAARLLAVYAVPRPCLVDCMRSHDVRGFLHRHLDDLERDRGLELFGLTATLARRRRLVWQPVITAMRDGPWPEDAGDPFADPDGDDGPLSG